MSTRNEKIISESEEKFRCLFYNHPEALVYLDDKGLVVDINSKFTELFGYTLEEIKGRNINEGFIHPDNLREEGEKLDQIALRTGYFNFETVRRKKDGTLFPVSISGSPVVINGRKVGIIGMYMDITERKKLEKEIKFSATHDFLTKLPNRSLLKDRFNVEVARAKRNNTKIGIMLLDLTDFKEINDTFGHDFGDLLLQKVAERFVETFRKSDTVSRIGGDEFVVLIPDIKDIEGLNEVAIRVIDAFKKPFLLKRKKVSIGLNIGISVYPDDARDLNTLLRKADIAMYNAKIIETNSFQYFDKSMVIKKDAVKDLIKISEIKFRAIFDRTPLGMIIVDNNGKIIDTNSQFEMISGFSKKEVIGKKFIGFLTPDNREIALRFKNYLNGKEDSFRIEMPLKGKKGDIRFVKVLFSSVPDIYEKSDYFIGMVEDITERVEALRFVEKERDRTKRYLDIAGVILMVTDLDGNVISINRKGCEILGLSEREIIGKNWIEHFIPERFKEELKDFYKRVKRGETKEIEYHENPILTDRMDGIREQNETNNIGSVTSKGRFPANLLVSDDVLDDGKKLNIMRILS